MEFDLVNDIVIVYGWKVGISTFIGWVSGLIGLYMNYKQLCKVAEIGDRKLREDEIERISKKSYTAIEKIVKLTPTKIDDKLIEYLKLAISSYEAAFGSKPKPKEVKRLIENAGALATDDKLKKLVSEEAE